MKSSHLANLRVDIKNPASSLSQLKGQSTRPRNRTYFNCHFLSTDKSEGGRVSGDFEDASQKLQEYCECLVIDVNERINVLDLLKECKAYQAHTLNEFQKMVTASKLLSV